MCDFNRDTGQGNRLRTTQCTRRFSVARTFHISKLPSDQAGWFVGFFAQGRSADACGMLSLTNEALFALPFLRRFDTAVVTVSVTTSLDSHAEGHSTGQLRTERYSAVFRNMIRRVRQTRHLGKNFVLAQSSV